MLNIPSSEHFAVIYNEHVYIPGDERSKKSPGHGYPEETRTFDVYKAFESQFELEKWIKDYGKYTQYTVVKAVPMVVSVIETVQIKEK